MSTGVKLHEHPIDPFKCHIESKKQTDVTRKRTRNQKSIEQKEDIQANDWRRKAIIQNKPPCNNEIPYNHIFSSPKKMGCVRILVMSLTFWDF